MFAPVTVFWNLHLTSIWSVGTQSGHCCLVRILMTLLAGGTLPSCVQQKSPSSLRSLASLSTRRWANFMAPHCFLKLTRGGLTPLPAPLCVSASLPALPTSLCRIGFYSDSWMSCFSWLLTAETYTDFLLTKFSAIMWGKVALRQSVTL